MNSDRYPFLDLSRFSFMLLGVPFHAAMMFAIGDDSFVKFDTRERLIGQLAGVPHIFRMEAFFILAAFLSSSMLEKYGPKLFTQKRTTRLLPPLLTGLFIQSLSGMVLAGQPLIEDYPAVQYLWFLPVLFTLALLQQQFFQPQLVSRLTPFSCSINKWIAAPLMTIITTIACCSVELLLKSLGIGALTSITAGILTGDNLAHFLPIYFVGVVLYRYRNSLDAILSAAPALLPLALFNFSKLDILAHPLVSMFAQILSALSLTCIAVAFFRFVVPQSWARPWMSNLSFSVYILHQPILCLLRWPVMMEFNGTYVRFAVLVTATFALCAAAHWLISRSFILSFLLIGELNTKISAQENRALKPNFQRTTGSSAHRVV